MNASNQRIVREFFDTRAHQWNDSCYTAEHKSRIPTIIDSLKISPGNTVLDVGSGAGILVPHLLASATCSGQIIELDISGNMLKEARNANGNQGIAYLQSGVEQLPLKNNAMDCIVCFSVFPHFENHRQALQELHRVICSDGILYILHLEGSDSLNACHRAIGGAVTQHKLPCGENMEQLLLSTGWVPDEIRDTDHEYFVSAHPNNN